jgi:prepilin peptidase CpaA
LTFESVVMGVETAAGLPGYMGLVLIALVLSASWIDVATRRIPNPLWVLGAVAGFFLSLWYGGLQGGLLSLAGFLLGLLLLMPGYLLRMTGGGDVKLFAAIGSLLGPRLILYAMLLYVLAGLCWAVVFGIYAWAVHGATMPFTRYGRMLRTFLTTGRVAYVCPRPGEAMAARVPMAPAIAFGAIAAPLWFG